MKINKNTNNFNLTLYTPLISLKGLFAVDQKRFHTCNYIHEFNPWFVTGLTDAKGCFYISITKNYKFKTGWKVLAFFELKLHKRDLELLNYIQVQLGGVGRIMPNGEEAYSFRVNVLNELLDVIIPHFNKYPLITQKLADYLLWKEIVNKMKNKEHLTYEGTLEIVSIRASINTGLSKVLNNEFSNVIPISRPLVENKEIPHEGWLAGFISGEGSLFVRVNKSRTNIWSRVQLEFILTQHTRDKNLLESFIKYLGCGTVRYYNNRDTCSFICTKYNDIYNIIIPFIKKYPILGVKSQDFNDWCKVVEEMKLGNHLTLEGLKRILKIKANMNRGRKLD
uniref:homing endonuclease n=1 Tax=Leptographium procerum TaxID=100367 RepID=UPI0023EFF165|nr:homing endonuclease [Leptographium procerum]WDW21011.1 homing endonuclease [Leptographium procerum]